MKEYKAEPKGTAIKTDTAVTPEDQKILDKAIKRFETSYKAYEESLENSELALDFRVLDQWPAEVRQARENDPDGPRPCLVVDKLGQYVHQIVNDFRQQKMGIEVIPVDSGADVEVAEILKDLVRRIENQSTASQAYNWAFQCAVETGQGYWRVVTEYENDTSFNQEIYIKKIPDVFSVYFDPTAIYTDGRDAEFAFVIEDMPKEDFEDLYGKELGSFDHTGMDYNTSWISDTHVRIAEYFYKEKVPVKIGLSLEGKNKTLEEGEDEKNYVKVREGFKCVVKWCKITSSRILEKGVWPSKYIPIVRIVGDEHRINNEGIYYQGMIYPAIDAQRMFNYSASSLTENVSLAPKAPYIVAAGQIENWSDEWSQANNRNLSVLRYDPISVDGNPVPPPIRNPLPGVPQGWSFIQQNMLDNIQQSLGMYQSNLGAGGNERTGAAITQRKTQGEHGQYHFFDNAAMAIEQTGRIIVDLIPKIYDTPKVMKIRGDDEMIKQVFINPELKTVIGKKINEINQVIGKEINPMIGNYDVVMSSGPSSATRRQETSKAMFQLAQTAPELMRVGGDIMVKNMDFSGSQELAQRIYRTIPPNITNPNPQMTPEMQQLMAQNEQLMAQVQKLESGVVEAMQKAQLDSQTKLQSVEMIQQSETARAQLKSQTDKEIAFIQESAKVKSAKLTSRGEVTEEIINNQGRFKAILMEQGYPPAVADEMLGTFQKIIKGEVLSDIVDSEKTEPELQKSQDKLKEEEQPFVDNY